MSELYELRELIDEYERLVQKQEDMFDDWENGSPEDQACSDPGLQYEKDMEVAAKHAEIILLCRQVVREYED